MRSLVFVLFCTAACPFIKAQSKAATPPMGFMTWNFFADNITEADVKSVADAMSLNGLAALGFNYIFIDDGWQGGRDNKNNIIPDPKKFPSGIQSLCDYVHSKGMKLGIYSDAAPLTCGGYTASLHFEEQDARSFAAWGIDYLKYDYCGAPPDQQTAAQRYARMAEALQKSGRNIVLSICEWGDREPWQWGRRSGGQLWRTTADIRDKWKCLQPYKNAKELHGLGAGILDVVNINAALDKFAGPGGWNDPDMLNIGLYGKKGPSGDLGGTGCTDVEYQSQMSLWCLMASPLMISCDVRHMNEATRRILTNKEVIAIDQDELGTQARRVINTGNWQVFVKPLQNGDYAVGLLNTGDQTASITIRPAELGISNKGTARDLWSNEKKRWNNQVKITAAAHETRLYRLSH